MYKDLWGCQHGRLRRVLYIYTISKKILCVFGLSLPLLLYFVYVRSKGSCGSGLYQNLIY